MSQKKTVQPPPFKKGLYGYLKNKLKVLSAITMALLAVASAGYLMIKMPETHGSFLRNKVGSKTYMIKGNSKSGGGTGFSIIAPSGESYIMTNAHVCDHSLKVTSIPGTVLVVTPEGAIRRRVIEVSDKTDLCLIEGVPNEKGLSVGSRPNLGEIVAVVGHPHLRPLSISRGEIVGQTDVSILEFVFSTGSPLLDAMLEAKEASCDLPKNAIVSVSESDPFLGEINLKLCLTVTKNAYMSTAVIFPGNSGSPVVDFWGRVIGVAFASDNTNWAMIVSLEDIKDLLSRY